MINVSFDTGETTLVVDVSELKIVIETMLSLKYQFTVSLSGIDSDLIPTIENAKTVKILVAKHLVAEGKYVSSEIHSVDDKITVNALFENTTMLAIKKTFLDDQIVNGDIVDELSRAISLLGIKVSLSTVSESRRCVLNGCLFNLLRNSTREKNTLWNISSNKIYIGNTVSERYHSLDKSTSIVFYNSFVNKNGVLVKYHDASVRYDTKIQPGDSITIDKNSYIVGSAKHFFVYRSQGNVLFSLTNLSLFSKIEDLYEYICIKDPLNETEDHVDSLVMKLLYDPVDNRPSFNDISREKWVCENEKVVAGGMQVGSGQGYLNTPLFCAMSATFGYNIPYDAVIIDYRLMLSSTDSAFIEIMRNGNVLYSIPCNTINKYEKIDVLFAPGVLAFRYTPGAGASGIARVFIELNYREFIRNS